MKIIKNIQEEYLDDVPVGTLMIYEGEYYLKLFPVFDCASTIVNMQDFKVYNYQKDWTKKVEVLSNVSLVIKDKEEEE